MYTIPRSTGGFYPEAQASARASRARFLAVGRSFCPHCGKLNQGKIKSLKGKAHRPGLYQCGEPECREQFTVTVGSVMHRSKLPLTKWVAAIHIMASSKKGMSAHHCTA
jgi:hypothetical protein